jgi:hypothetical protein
VPRARLELVLYLTHPDLISGLLSKVELSLPSLKKKKKKKENLCISNQITLWNLEPWIQMAFRRGERR